MPSKNSGPTPSSATEDGKRPGGGSVRGTICSLFLSRDAREMRLIP